MSHTIDLLEVIGRDASLRHASGEALTRALTELHASDALMQAAISGDDNHLARELGHRDVKAPNHVNNNVGGGHDDLDNELGGTGQADGNGDGKAAEDVG